LHKSALPGRTVRGTSELCDSNFSGIDQTGVCG
jgi:hypothetical protein